jgi:hypothetical protein
MGMGIVREGIGFGKWGTRWGLADRQIDRMGEAILDLFVEGIAKR